MNAELAKIYIADSVTVSWLRLKSVSELIQCTLMVFGKFICVKNKLLLPITYINHYYVMYFQEARNRKNLPGRHFKF